MFQRSNISVNSLDLCDQRITRILANFLRIIDISRSDNLDVRILVNVLFINKTISIVKVPMRLRSSTLELTGVYFRGELNYFGHMGRQNISLGRKRAQKCLISICSFNSIL